MSNASYQWLEDLIAAEIVRKKLRKLRKGDIQEYLRQHPVVQREVHTVGEHNPAFEDMFWHKTSPLLIREALVRPKQVIYYPKTAANPSGKKVFTRVRLYPAFWWGGDIYYQHRWGMEAAEAEQVFLNQRKNRINVSRHEHFEEVYMNYLKAHGGRGEFVNIDTLMADLLQQHPEYNLITP